MTSQLNNLKSQRIADEVKKVDDKVKKILLIFLMLKSKVDNNKTDNDNLETKVDNNHLTAKFDGIDLTIYVKKVIMTLKLVI